MYPSRVSRTQKLFYWVTFWKKLLPFLYIPNPCYRAIVNRNYGRNQEMMLLVVTQSVTSLWVCKELNWDQ